MNSNASAITRLLALLLLAWAGSASTAYAQGTDERTREAFESMYGAELLKVRATRSIDDDITLARRMLEAGRSAKDNAALQFVLLLGAADLGWNSARGRDVALEAIQVALALTPERGSEIEEELIAQRERQAALGFNPGDQLRFRRMVLQDMLDIADYRALTSRLEGAAQMYKRALAAAKKLGANIQPLEVRQPYWAQLDRGLKQAKELLRTPSQPGQTAELMLIYLVQFDQPLEAAKLVAKVNDSTLKRFVPIAAGLATDVKPMDHLATAEWYQQLASEAPTSSKHALLLRAKAHYQQFLGGYATKDAVRDKAELTLEQLADELAKLPEMSLRVTLPPLQPAENTPVRTVQKVSDGRPDAQAYAAATQPSGAVDVLRVLDPETDVLLGTGVKLSSSRESQGLELSIPQSLQAMVQAPVEVTGTYDLSLMAKGPGDGGSLLLVVPVSSRQALLQLGEISRVWSQAGSTRTVPVSDWDRSHRIRVMVREQSPLVASIRVLADDTELIAWTGSPSELVVPEALALTDPTALGVGVFRGSLKLTQWMIVPQQGGKVKLTRQAPLALGQGVVDLLAKTDPARDAVAGKWTRREDGALELSAGSFGRIAAAVHPTGSYVLAATLERRNGTGPLMLHLPIAEFPVAVMLGDTVNDRPGVSFQRIADAQQAEVARPWPTIADPGIMHVVAQVKLESGGRCRIDVQIDGAQALVWSGSMSRAAVPDAWALADPLSPGIGGHNVSLVVHSFRLRMTEGDAIVLGR